MSVLVANIPPEASLAQIRYFLGRAGAIRNITEPSHSGSAYGSYVYCQYTSPAAAAEAVQFLNGRSLLNGYPRLSHRQPPPPGLDPIPMASLIPSNEDVLRTTPPLPILHPPTPMTVPIPTIPQQYPISHPTTPPPSILFSNPPLLYFLLSPRRPLQRRSQCRSQRRSHSRNRHMRFHLIFPHIGLSLPILSPQLLMSSPPRSLLSLGMCRQRGMVLTSTLGDSKSTPCSETAHTRSRFWPHMFANRSVENPVG